MQEDEFEEFAIPGGSEVLRACVRMYVCVLVGHASLCCLVVVLACARQRYERSEIYSGHFISMRVLCAHSA